jgi:hypothetical protein
MSAVARLLPSRHTAVVATVSTQGPPGQHPDGSTPASPPPLRAGAPAAGMGPAAGRDRAPQRGPPQHPRRSPLPVATPEPDGVCSHTSPCRSFTSSSWSSAWVLRASACLPAVRVPSTSSGTEPRSGSRSSWASCCSAPVVVISPVRTTNHRIPGPMHDVPLQLHCPRAFRSSWPCLGQRSPLTRTRQSSQTCAVTMTR